MLVCCSCRPKFNGSFSPFSSPNLEAAIGVHSAPLVRPSAAAPSFISYAADVCTRWRRRSAAAIASGGRLGCGSLAQSTAVGHCASCRNSSPVRRGAPHTCRWKAVDAGEVRAAVGSERTVGRLQRGAISAIAAAAVRRQMRRRCSRRWTAGRSARPSEDTQSERLHRARRSRGDHYHSPSGHSAEARTAWAATRSLTLDCHSHPILFLSQPIRLSALTTTARSRFPAPVASPHHIHLA